MTHEALNEWFKGDAGAVEFATTLWAAMEEWDDVVDEGKTDKVNDLISFLTFRMSYLPFFKAYEYIIRPVLLVAYLGWRDANVLEKGDAADLEKAFMLRAGIYDVFAVMAWIIGGEAHSQLVGPKIRRFYKERLADYIREHEHA